MKLTPQKLEGWGYLVKQQVDGFAVLDCIFLCLLTKSQQARRRQLTHTGSIYMIT